MDSYGTTTRNYNTCSLFWKRKISATIDIIFGLFRLIVIDLWKVTIVFAVYPLVAIIQNRHDAAIYWGDRIISAEEYVGLNIELSIQEFFLRYMSVLTPFVSYFYFAFHIPLTLAFVFSLRLYHEQACQRLQHIFFSSNFICYLIYLIVPTAPPRMYDGFTDTTLSEVDSILMLKYGSLPSLHCLYAALLGLVIVRIQTNAFWMFVIYNVLVCLAVIVTANHFLLDIVASWIVLLISHLLYERSVGNMQLKKKEDIDV